MLKNGEVSELHVSVQLKIVESLATLPEKIKLPSMSFLVQSQQWKHQKNM